MIVFCMLYIIGLIGFIAQFFYIFDWLLLPLSILILLNATLSFKWIWREQGKIFQVFIVNVFQLVIFTCVFRFIYFLKGAEHYVFANPPQLWDWCQLTLVHVLRAADFMDAIEGYGWQLQNIKSQGYISGTPLVLLHLLVDFFLFTALYKLFSGTFIKKMIPIAKKLGKLFFILGVLGLIGILLYKFQVYYPFLIWTFICLAMLATVRHWNFDLIKRFKGGYRGENVVYTIKEDSPLFLGFLFYGLLGICIFLYWKGGENLLWQGLTCFFYLFIALLLFAITMNILHYLLFLISKIAIVFAFIPLLLFTILLGIFSHWLHPNWLQGNVSFSIFAWENLFRAIDLLDMSQIYGWNWSGGQYESWIFASLVVSYRFLVSAFFYQMIYRLILLWGASKVLPIEKTIEMLKDTDHTISISAQEELLASTDPRIVPYVFPLLDKNESEDMRLLALKICNKLANSTAIVFLAPLALEETTKIRIAALEILEKFPSKKVSPHLIKFLENKDSQIRQATKNALERLQAQECIKHIISLTKHKEAAIREVAVETLISLDAKIVTEILPLLSDSEAKVRVVTLQALEYWADKKVITQVIPLLKDNYSDVRSAAIETLGALKANNAIAHIVPLLQDEDYFVRSRAAQILGDLQAKSEVNNILPLLKDKEPFVQEEAICSLGKLKAKEAIPNLISLLSPLFQKRTIRGRFGDLEDWDWETKEKRDIAFRALEVLGDLKEKQALKSIHQLSKIEEEDVQKAVKETLLKIENTSNPGKK